MLGWMSTKQGWQTYNNSFRGWLYYGSQTAVLSTFQEISCHINVMLCA
jgi:hypothetical protein